MDTGERQVEIPWLRKVIETQLPKAGRCLDVGSGGAGYLDYFSEDVLVDRLDRNQIPDDGKHTIICKDIRDLDSPKTYTSVLIISALEHLGLNAYGFQADYSDPVKGQRDAFNHCFDLVIPDGFLAVTLPFGAFENGEWYLTYNVEMVDGLIGNKNVINETYFTLDTESWTYHRVPRYECPLRGQDWVRSDFSRATSICCLLIQKTCRYIYGPKINLGCGNAKLGGFIGVDSVSLSEEIIKQDYYCYMERCPDDSVEHLVMSHSLEHIPLKIIPHFLDECYRSLKNGGLLEIVLPDGDWYLDRYIKKEIDYTLLNKCLYADSVHEWDIHQWLPTIDVVKKFIDNTNFSDCSYFTGDGNIGVHCRK